MWEETESTQARVYTTYGIQRRVRNRRSIPRTHTGAEDVGNLNSSVRGERKNLNILRRWRVILNLVAFGHICEPSEFLARKVKWSYIMEGWMHKIARCFDGTLKFVDSLRRERPFSKLIQGRGGNKRSLLNGWILWYTLAYLCEFAPATSFLFPAVQTTLRQCHLPKKDSRIHFKMKNMVFG